MPEKIDYIIHENEISSGSSNIEKELESIQSQLNNSDCENDLNQPFELVNTKSFHNMSENIDHLTAQEVEYNINYNVKQLKYIAEYYSLKSKKLSKEKLIQSIIEYENDEANYERVVTRKQLWFYLEELKNDDYTKKFVFM